MANKTQTGAATLLMATVLLMAVSVISIYSSRSGIVDQKIAANTVHGQHTADIAQLVMDKITTKTQSELKAMAAPAVFTNSPKDLYDKITMDNPGLSFTATVTDAFPTDKYQVADIVVKVTGANSSAVRARKGLMASALGAVRTVLTFTPTRFISGEKSGRRASTPIEPVMVEGSARMREAEQEIQ